MAERSQLCAPVTIALLYLEREKTAFRMVNLLYNRPQSPHERFRLAISFSLQLLDNPTTPNKNQAIAFNVLSVLAGLLLALVWRGLSFFVSFIGVGIIVLPLTMLGIPPYLFLPIAGFIIHVGLAYVVYRFMKRRYSLFAKTFLILSIIFGLFASVPLISMTGKFALEQRNYEQNQEIQNQEQGHYSILKDAQKDPENVLDFESQESTFPMQVLEFKNLQSLILNNNQLSHIPDEISQLTKLERLIIYTNNLDRLPSSITQLQNLKVLMVGGNGYGSKFAALPSDIGNLVNLEELSLQYNPISSLPPSIGGLKKLRKLNMKSNNLTTLPPEIGQLTQLEELEVDFNPITSWPKEMANLSVNLKRLYAPSNMPVEVENDLVRMLPNTKFYLYP